MAGTEVGFGYISLIPKLSQNFKMSADKAAADFGSNFNKGIGAFGVAAGNILANALQSTIGNVGQLMSDSIAYSDALTRFPLVLESLGVGGDKAAVAIEKLKSGLEGTPILVSDATAAVQRLIATTGEVEKSTDWFIAFNDAVMAGGAPFNVQQAAIEQWQQAVSKGRPDRIEFRSFLQAMPGTMRQMAQELGVSLDGLQKMFDSRTKGPKLTMEQFNDILLKLDKTGAAGFANLHDQARKALVGIDTGIGLVRKSILETFGNMFAKLNISSQVGVFQDLGKAIANVFDNTFGGVATNLAKNIQAGLDAINVAKSVENFVGPVEDGFDSIKELGLKGFVGPISPEYEAQLEKNVQNLINFKNIVKDVTDNVGKYFTDLSTSLSDGGFESLLNLVTPTIQAFGILAGAIAEVVKASVDFAKQYPGVTQAIGQTIGVIIGVKTAWSLLGKVFGAKGLLGGLLQTAVKDAGSLKRIFTNITGTFKWFGSSVTTTLNPKNLKDVWTRFKGAIGDEETDSFKKLFEKIKNPAKEMGESLSETATKTGNAGKGVSDAGKKIKDAGKDIEEAGKGAANGSKSFGTLAGEALKIVAIGGSIMLAGQGLKAMGEGAASVGESGPGANVALAEMGGIFLGFSAIIATLGKDLATTWPQLLALGGATLLAGIGLAAMSVGAKMIGEAGPGANVALAIMGGTLIGLVAVIGAFAPALDAATPFVIAFGGAILAAGIGVGAASYGISLLLQQLPPVIDAVGRLADKLGITNTQGQQANNVLDGLNSGAGKAAEGIGRAVDGIGGLVAGLGDIAEAAGLTVLSWSLNAVADAMGRLNESGGSAQSAIWGIATASDSAGGALGNLAGTGQSSALAIQGAYDNLSNAIYGVSNQITGSITNGFNAGTANGVNACWSLKGQAESILSSIADSAYWSGRNVGEKWADGVRDGAGSIQGILNNIKPNPNTITPNTSLNANNVNTDYNRYGNLKAGIKIALGKMKIEKEQKEKEKEKVPIVMNFYDTQTSPNAIYQKFMQSNTYGLAKNYG